MSEVAACKHCWHETGGGMSLGWHSGSNNVQCCQCGARGVRGYMDQARRIKGHGPYATRYERVYGQVEIMPRRIVLSGNAFNDAPRVAAASRDTQETEQ